MSYTWSPKPAFVTDESLTKGIALREINVDSNGDYFYNWKKGYNPAHVKESDIHKDFESAFEHSKTMRDEKIKKLENEIEALKQLDFSTIRNCVW